MPLIEELPTTATHRVTHGWAYVPDTGPTAIAAVQPGNRKRGAGGQRDGTATATAKQQKAIQLRLASLDKENYKDGVIIPIPPRADKKNRKMTTNVRRILTSQRAFAHYLADEEANTAPNTSTTHPSSSTHPTTASRADARRKSTNANPVEQPTSTTTENTSTAPTPSGRGRRRKTLTTTDKDKDKDTPKPPPPAKEQEDVVMTDAPASSTPTTITAPTSMTIPAPTPRPPYDPKLDAHPLLRTTDLPKMPTARVMQALLAEPPLSYAAARARLPDDAPSVPARHFCGVCGYWGRVKCRKCADWTCGLMECWKGHEGVCPALGVY